ncbi:MAG TPA: Fe2+-dependent dioxygenase [Burkholderiaceae bacterium]|nr:Fe2+-dependent dioxygenase [Burkholderiaceae bacterium]
MLITLPKLLSPEETTHCRNALEAANWVDGRQTAGHFAAQVKQNQQLALDNPVGQQLGDLILKALSRNQRFIAAALPLRILPPRFNRYTGGGTYGKHIDNAIFHVPELRQQIRSDISITVFLSEPSQYEGGELVIDDNYAQQRIKLAAGDAVVYPGNSLHHVTPVTSGVRLASFFWIQSLVRQANRRQILFDLDQSIQTLASTSSGNSDALERLSGVYHNLLREWSDT